LWALPDGGERAWAFAGLWTAREAYAKALGRGLTLSLGSYEVAGELDRPALVRAAPEDPRGAGGWLLASRRVGDDHVCTVACPGRRIVLVEFGPAVS
jgi:phosphopantetheinyl transferase